MREFDDAVVKNFKKTEVLSDQKASLQATCENHNHYDFTWTFDMANTHITLPNHAQINAELVKLTTID